MQFHCCLFEALSPKMTFCHNCCEDIFLGNISPGHTPPPNDHPLKTISEPYKHLTIAKAYIGRQLAPWRKRHIWVWSVSDVSSRIRVRAALPS